MAPSISVNDIAAQVDEWLLTQHELDTRGRPCWPHADGGVKLQPEDYEIIVYYHGNWALRLTGYMPLKTAAVLVMVMVQTQIAEELAKAEKP